VITHLHSTRRSEHNDRSVVEAPADIATKPKRERDEGLDWVKGILVVLMVVYHSLNYSPYSHLAFIYLGFLPVSFIFIAGFLLTNSYLARYDLKDWRLHRRLVIRGAKLIAIFTALNLGLYFIAWRQGFLQEFSENFQTIYLGAAGHVASFPILTSIGYLLLLAPLLLGLGSLNRWVLPALAFALVVLCSLMEWKASVGYHLGMISAGIIGTAFGLLPLRRVTGFARKSFVVIVLYCVYRTCSYFIGDPYALQLTGVVTGLLLLYSLALKLPVETHIFREVVLLGRYSLLGYIMQLGIIQVTVRMFGPFTTPLAVVILALVALASTWAVTVIVHRLRAKARLVDVTYKAAFA
jgi:peptidoglycan/LPS O-acetylase OafA/YrhL